MSIQLNTWTGSWVASRLRTSQYCFIVLTLLFYPGVFAQRDPDAWDMMQAEGEKITHTENKPAELPSPFYKGDRRRTISKKSRFWIEWASTQISIVDTGSRLPSIFSSLSLPRFYPPRTLRGFQSPLPPAFLLCAMLVWPLCSVQSGRSSLQPLSPWPGSPELSILCPLTSSFPVSCCKFFIHHFHIPFWILAIYLVSIWQNNSEFLDVDSVTALHRILCSDETWGPAFSSEEP